VFNDKCGWKHFRVRVILNVSDSGVLGHGTGSGSSRCQGLWVHGFVQQDPSSGPLHHWFGTKHNAQDLVDLCT
jgi:hypothetical protein